MPEHKDLTGADLHEPKGVTTADQRTMYVANGVGGGSWQHSLMGVHGEMLIQNNAAPQVTPVALDPTLNTDSDYVLLNTNWLSGHLDGVLFNVNHLIVPVNGDYFLTAWADMFIPSNNQKVGLKYVINGTPPYSARKLVATSANAGDVANISGGGFVTMNAGDTVGLVIATDKAGDPVVNEAGVVLFLVHENP